MGKELHFPSGYLVDYLPGRGCGNCTHGGKRQITVRTRDLGTILRVRATYYTSQLKAGLSKSSGGIPCCRVHRFLPSSFRMLWVLQVMSPSHRDVGASTSMQDIMASQDLILDV